VTSIEFYFDQLLVWSQQTKPLYWLIIAILIACVLLLILRRKISNERQRCAELEITQATHIEKLQALESALANQQQANTELLEKLERDSQKNTQLVSDAGQLKASAEERLTQLNRLHNEQNGLREQLDNATQQISNFKASVLESETKLAAEKDKLAELKAQFEQQKDQLKNEFKVVSEEIIKQRQSQLNEQNKEGVSALLKPLQDQIKGFQERVNEVHNESIKGNVSLKTEIENVMKMGLKMSNEAQNLTTALKGDSQQSGAWGEAQLERTLEMSGLIESDHFEKQTSFVDDDGRVKRTDYLIKLPGDKCLIIDSKVSLNDYERAISEEPELQAVSMKKHIEAVRKHIKDLASKEYTNLNGVHSPDFVLMFMPIEPAYIEAMKHDTQLFSFGYERNVILVSHTTLIPILRTVANLWMLDRSNKEARVIGDKANDIFNSVALVSERLESLGKTLTTASKHYNNTVKAITGNQGLQGKVKRFTELSSKTKKKMVELEPNNSEFDAVPLSVERLESNQQSEEDSND